MRGGRELFPPIGDVTKGTNIMPYNISFVKYIFNKED